VVSTLREPLTIAVAQPGCQPYDVERNARAHAAAVRAAAARVVVFPELSLTGYELDAPPVADDDPRLASLVEACGTTGTLALAGAPVEGVGGRRHIAMIAVEGGRAWTCYRKLVIADGESSRFSPGDAPVVLGVDGWQLGLAICKDTSVPEHAADTAALGADMYVAGMVLEVEEESIMALRARRVAETLGLPTAIASFAGPTGDYRPALGRSGIWDATGAERARAGVAPGEAVRTVLSAT
jgi:predicted amidohydrolase